MFLLSDDTERQPMEKGIFLFLFLQSKTHIHATHTHMYIHMCVFTYECIFICVYTVTHITHTSHLHQCTSK